MSMVNPLFWNDSIHITDLLIERRVNHFFVTKKLLYLKGGVDLVQSWHNIVL